MLGSMTLISSAINKAVSSDPANRDYLRSLGDICLLIHSESPEFSIYVKINDGLISLHSKISDDDNSEDTQECNLRIRATALNLVKLLLTPADNAAALREANVHVEGDVALLLELSQVIKQVAIDWEALLADHIGDYPAVLLSRGAKRAKTETSKAFSAQKAFMEDWLQRPDAPVPNRTEYETLKNSLRDLNYRLDRLDATFAQRTTKSATDQ